MTVNVWESSDYFDAFVGDCGPYVGPWPPAPPIPANLPDIADCGELDYFISAAPLADVVDGSYSGDSLDVYRYYTGTGVETNARSGIGSAVVTGNLFVLFYTADFSWPAAGDPTPLPLDLVPSLYVAGGAGSPVPDPAGGHWSSDQPASTTTSFAFGAGYAGQFASRTTPDGQHHDGPGDSPGDVNVATEMAARVADLVANWVAVTGEEWAAATGFYLPGSGVSFKADKDINPTVEDPTPALYHDVQAGVNQVAVNYSASTPSLPFPDLLAGLIEGLDYTAPPSLGMGETDVGGAVYPGPPTFVSWIDRTDVTYTIILANADDPTKFPPDESVTIIGRVRLAIVDPSAVVAGPPFSYSMGDTLVEVSTTTAGTTTQTVTLPISSIADPEFGVVALSGFLGPDGQPLSEYAAPGTVGEILSLLWTVEMDPSMGGSFNANFDVPGWRYWIPGGLAWHTVAASWASISGAPMAIFTPGLGPVDYADGPA